jgi:negative regulator of sigma E activity
MTNDRPPRPAIQPAFDPPPTAKEVLKEWAAIVVVVAVLAGITCATIQGCRAMIRCESREESSRWPSPEKLRTELKSIGG